MSRRVLLTPLWLISIVFLLAGCMARAPSTLKAIASASPTRGLAPLTVNFEASASLLPPSPLGLASVDLEEAPLSFEWDFGDGFTARGRKVTHTYQDNGVFTAVLKVSDGFGRTAQDKVKIEVLNPPPMSLFTFSPQNPKTKEVVTFDASDSFDPASAQPLKITSFEWNFGDGSKGFGLITTHAYDDNGEFTVTLTVIDDDGAVNTSRQKIIVQNRPPQAGFTLSPPLLFPIGVAPLNITFDAAGSFDPDGKIVNFKWDFGDGTTGTGQKVSHTYSRDGVFTVTLTVTDDDGAESSTSVTIEISNPGPIPRFTFSPTSPLTNEVVTFDATGSSDPLALVPQGITEFHWDFGDGTTGTGVIVTHAYSNNGEFKVTLTIKDNSGNVSSTTQKITVRNRPPTPDTVKFKVSSSKGKAPLTVVFDASESFDPDGGTLRFDYDFGDGTTAQNAGPLISHTYTRAGKFIPKLTVTDDDGGKIEVVLAALTINVLNLEASSSRIKVRLGPSALTVGDFNADGFLDLANTNLGSNDVSSLLGLGNGNFGMPTHIGAGTGLEAITTGDFNRDGKLELAVANGNTNSVSILIGYGDGKFQPLGLTQVFSVGMAPVSVTTEDFNEDGILDLATANSGSNNVSVLLGRGDGTFQPATHFTVGISPRQVITADFNKDGLLDLATANFSSNNVSILLGNGNGTFDSAKTFSAGINAEALVAGDFNKDSKLDLAVANSGNDSVSVLLGNGDGTFGAAVNFTVGSRPKAITAGDFDGDNLLDLATANAADNTISILLSKGDGTFESALSFRTGVSPEAIVAADLNGDGTLDLVTANKSSNDLTIMLNFTL